MNLTPLHDRVLVLWADAETVTAGGIILPDAAKEKPQTGEVLSTGPGARNAAGEIEPLTVKAGDRVMFGQFAGHEVKIDGRRCLIMREADIFGIIAA